MKVFVICIFLLLQSCASLNEFILSDSFKISATASSHSKEQAMAEAHKRALLKIDDLGCDHDKGRGDVSYKRMGGAFIAEAVYKISKEFCEKRVSCKDEEWTQGPVRSQFGEWRFFRGKGVSVSRVEADELAKTDAMKHLESECGTLNKEVRFIERCEDFTSNSFVVITRASIKHLHCK